MIEQEAAAVLERLVALGHVRWVVCFSAGVDSRVLLDVCVKCAPRLGAEVSSVHVHHGMREGADEDAALCERVARAYGIAHTTHRVSVRKKSSAQRAARAQRWALIHLTLAARASSCALTAHHEDDVFETFLMHAARGSGVQGLVSLASEWAPAPHGARLEGAHTTSPITGRPLIGASRAQIEAYAREHRLSWATDPTNATPAYLRNRVRHGALRALLQEDGARAGLRHTLHNLTQLSQEQHAQAQALLERAHMEGAVIGEVWLARGVLASAPASTQARSLRLVHERLHVRKAWSQQTLLALQEAARAKAPGKLSLPGAFAQWSEQRLSIMAVQTGRGEAGALRAVSPRRIDLEQEPSGALGWFGELIRWERVRRPQANSAQQVYVRLEDVEQGLWVRGASGGEQLCAKGTPSKRVGELWRAAGVAPLERWRQACVSEAGDDRIFWVPGKWHQDVAVCDDKAWTWVRLWCEKRPGK